MTESTADRLHAAIEDFQESVDRLHAAMAERTVNCDEGQHDWCDGYAEPLVNGDTHPCFCRCHDHGNPRNLPRGIEHGRAGQ